MSLVFTFQYILVNFYTHNFISLGSPVYICSALGAIDSWINIYKKVKENQYKLRYKLLIIFIILGSSTVKKVTTEDFSLKVHFNLA